MPLTSASESGNHDRLPRAGWISARARNASRRGWRIALVGGLALSATALVLVLLPRGADRAVRAELDRLAPPIDTVALLARLDSLTAQRAQDRRTDSLRADSLRAGSAAASSSAIAAEIFAATSAATAPVTSAAIVPPDAAMRELQQLLQRARDVPLVESYRALAQAAALRADRRALALADSIESLHREREAYAALGGADARYASLTTQLAALGQRLVRLGAVRLRDAQRPAAASAPSVTDSTVRAAPVAVADSSANASVDSTADSTVGSTPTGGATVAAPSLAAADIAAREDERVRGEAVERAVRAQLASARSENDRGAARRRMLEARLSQSVPPAAVLLAALVVGGSLGYASAMWRELRQPTVSDEGEVERLTGTRVIAASAVPPKRRRRNATARSVRDDANAAYPLVHLALTGIGEVARSVQVVAESRRSAAIVAVQVGVVAAGESRAVSIVELAEAPATVTPLLRERYGLTVPAAPSVRTSRNGERAVTTVTIDRDLSMDVRRAAADSAPEADAYDLTLMPQDADDFARDQQSSASDLVMCVRVGETPLAWLSAVVRQARMRGVRIRAVLLWAGRVPGQ